MLKLLIFTVIVAIVLFVTGQYIAPEYIHPQYGCCWLSFLRLLLLVTGLHPGEYKKTRIIWWSIIFQLC
jgi:hypothetical protein